jgi:hypothetical protein
LSDSETQGPIVVSGKSRISLRSIRATLAATRHHLGRLDPGDAVQRETRTIPIV